MLCYCRLPLPHNTDINGGPGVQKTGSMVTMLELLHHAVLNWSVVMVAHLQLVVRCGRGEGQCSAEGGTCLGHAFFGRLSSDKEVELNWRPTVGREGILEVNSRFYRNFSVWLKTFNAACLVLSLTPLILYYLAISMCLHTHMYTHVHAQAINHINSLSKLS